MKARNGHKLKIRNDSCLMKGAGVVIAVRPENLFISREPEKNSIPGVIEEKIFMGSFMRYRIMMATDDLVQVEIAEAVDKTFNIGDNVNVIFRSEKLLVYPRPKEGLQEVLSLE